MTSMRVKRVLILTSETGGGHVSLAEAIRDLLTDWSPDFTEAAAHPAENETLAITIADPQPKAFHLHYRLVSRHALWLWAAEYRMLDLPRRARIAHRVFTSLVHRQLGALIDAAQPDLIVSTYPFFSSAVMETLKRCRADIPLVLLFSDASGIHAAWLAERGAAATLAPTRETYQQAQAAGFAPERLHLTGWPVRKQFARAHPAPQVERAETLAALKLDPDRFTIFLQGGREGAAYVERAIESARSIPGASGGAQIILAAGANRGLLARYSGRRGIAAFPYTQNIAPYMSAADVIMGKAGPNALFESVMLGKPFIATTYIPGQEHANLAFIQTHGLGWIALTAERQRALLAKLVDDADMLPAMISTVHAYRQWNLEATARIAPMLSALMSTSKPA